MLLSWAWFPFLIEYVVSVVGRPVMVSNYLISSLPPILLLAARGLTVLRFNRLVLTGAVVILLACALPGAYASLVVNQREDFRAAVATFSSRFQASDQILFASPGARNAFAYYYRSPVAHEAVIGAPTTNADDGTRTELHLGIRPVWHRPQHPAVRPDPGSVSRAQNLRLPWREFISVRPAMTSARRSGDRFETRPGPTSSGPAGLP